MHSIAWDIRQLQLDNRSVTPQNHNNMIQPFIILSVQTQL